MPDVGLTTATEPVPPDEKVTIKYSVQVGGAGCLFRNL